MLTVAAQAPRRAGGCGSQQPTTSVSLAHFPPHASPSPFVLWDGGPDRVLPSPFCLFTPMGPHIPSPLGSSFPLDPAVLFPLAYAQYLWLFEHFHSGPLFVLFVSPTSLSLFPIFPWTGEVGLCCLQLTPPPQSWGCRVCWKGGHMGLVVLREEQDPKSPEAEGRMVNNGDSGFSKDSGTRWG